MFKIAYSTSCIRLFLGRWSRVCGWRIWETTKTNFPLALLLRLFSSSLSALFKTLTVAAWVALSRDQNVLCAVCPIAIHVYCDWARWLGSWFYLLERALSSFLAGCEPNSLSDVQKSFAGERHISCSRHPWSPKRTGGWALLNEIQ